MCVGGVLAVLETDRGCQANPTEIRGTDQATPPTAMFSLVRETPRLPPAEAAGPCPVWMPSAAQELLMLGAPHHAVRKPIDFIDFFAHVCIHVCVFMYEHTYVRACVGTCVWRTEVDV